MRALPAALLLSLLPVVAWAAPSPTALVDCTTATNCRDTTDQEVYTTPSVTVSAGAVVILVAALNDGNSSTPADPTIAGTLSATWTKIGSRCGGELAVWMWWAYFPSGGTGTITIDADGTQDTGAWFVVEWSGVNTTSPVVQSKCATVGAGTSIGPVTFDSAYASSNNRPFAFARNHGVGGTITEESGWTDLPNTYNSGIENGVYAGQWRDDATDTATTVTASVSAQGQIMMIELAAAATATDTFMGNGMSAGGFMD